MVKTNVFRKGFNSRIPKRLILSSLVLCSSYSYSKLPSQNPVIEPTVAMAQRMRSNKMMMMDLSMQSKQDSKVVVLKGIVYDSTGETLPGATIKIISKSQGTVTDFDGHFKLRASIGDKIEVSYLGMTPKTIIAKDGKPLKITLKDDTKVLDEVVVTGYQTISRERATGSYNILKKENLEKPASNIGSRLIGTSAGVQATIDADGNPKFEIRGLSSLGSNASPLVVVDGFAIEGDLNSINPNDVESITILKDAAAASIWGARSANGVIVVTTKTGKKSDKGKINIEYSNFFKVSNKADLSYLRPYASSEETINYDQMAYGKRWGFRDFIDSERGLHTTSRFGSRIALSENGLGYLSDADLKQRLATLRGIDNRQQIEDNLLQNPFTQQHNLSLSFANDKFNAYSSVMYQKSDKYLKNNSNERAMFNFRSNYKVAKWINLNLNTVLIYDKDNRNNAGVPKLPRYENLLDADGNYLNVPKDLYMPNMERYVPMNKFPYSDWSYNPITEMNNTDISNKSLTARLLAGVKIDIIDGLSLKGRVQYELRNDYQRSYYNDQTYFTRMKVNQGASWDQATQVTPNIPMGGILDQNRNEYGSLSFQGMVNFNKEINEKHSIALVAGIETNNKFHDVTSQPRVYGYDEERLTIGAFPNGTGSYTNSALYLTDWMGQKMTIPQEYHFSHYDDRFFSAYANANYTYDRKYSFSASIRTDASNLITDDPKYRYAPFWSLGASWQLGNEDYIKEISWIDQLTLRATYGYNGNIDRSTSFKPLINASSSNNQYTQKPYASVASFGNPTLRWEKTSSFDLGVDYSLMGNKLYGSVDYYHKKGTDLIAEISIPSTNGTTSQKLNTAEMVNQGIELQIGSNLDIIPHQLRWRGKLNLAYNLNKITKLFNVGFQYSDLFPWDGGNVSYVEGENAYSVWGMKYNGLQNTGTEASPNQQPTIVGKDGTTYTLSSFPTGDVLNYAYHQGTRVAPLTLGFSSGLSYKNFDLSFIITGKFGHVFQRTAYNYGGNIPNKYLSEALNADPNKMLTLPVNDDESRYFYWNRFAPFFSYTTESANLIRMQEIALSYQFPKALISNWKISNLKVYAQVNNAFSIFANKYNEDPEFKLGTYRLQPTFTFGLSVGL